MNVSVTRKFKLNLIIFQISMKSLAKVIFFIRKQFVLDSAMHEKQFIYSVYAFNDQI